MTQPNPPDNNNPLSPFTDLLKTIAEAFTKLPPLLAYGGLLAVLIIVGLSSFGVIPDALLWIPAIAIGAFLIVTFIDRWFNLQERKLSSTTNPPDSEPEPTPALTPPKPDDRTSDTEVSQAKLEQSYLRHLLTHHNQLPLALMDIREADDRSTPLLLQEIFTPLDVLAQQQRVESLSDETLAAAQSAGRLPRELALKALSRQENKKLVLLGDPGAGKSTLVNYLTLCLAGDHLGREEINQGHLQAHGWELGQRRLWPVHVVLREYAAHGLSQGQSVWDFIAAELKKPGISLEGYIPLLKARLETKGGLVMLDGLDEVDQAVSIRDALKREILNFARDFPETHVLVTSRPYAYSGGWHLSGFQVTRLLPFAEEQIKTFVSQWYEAKGVKDSALGIERAEQFATSLLQQVERNDHLQELAEQPLLLTMMVLVHRGQQGGQLPEKRAKLYDECVKLLLVRWQRGKTVSGQEAKSLTELLGIDIDELLKRLAEVAYTGHRDQPQNKRTADIPGKTLAGILYGSPGRPIKITYKEFVEYLRDKAGLLADHGPDPDGSDHIYRFPHRTFQEYLAGLHFLNDNNYPQRLVEAAASDPLRWRETVLLAAGSDPRPHMIWTMAQELCPDPPPVGGTATRPNADWQAFLAAQVLVDTDQIEADNQGSIARKTRPLIQKWQRAIVEKGLLPPLYRALAGEALATLGDDRPGVLGCDGMRLCFVPPGEFWLDSWDDRARGDWYAGLDKAYWLAQYPVTVAQFREFVADQPDDFRPSLGERPLQGPDNWPVAWINWYDALAFCDWLDKRWRGRGWLPPGYRVTLPSETEWEKGARGGKVILAAPQIVTAARLGKSLAQPPATHANDLSRRRYPWGDEAEEAEIERGMEERGARGEERKSTLDRANNKSAGIGGRCAVGSFPAGISPYGCLDMSGQVWEWTRSFYDQKYPPQPTPEFETIDPRNKEIMVIRGGAYYQDQNGCSGRPGLPPRDLIYDYDGVRVCVSPFPASAL